MRRGTGRALRVSVASVGLGMCVFFAGRFPWHQTLQALREASAGLVAAAVAVNLLALLAKGLAWHLILRAQTPHRLRSALEATLIGAAVSCLGVSLGGEAARVHVLSRGEKVGYGAVARSVLASRVVEAIALALLLALAPVALPLGRWSTALAIAAWGGLGLGLIAWRLRGFAALAGVRPVLPLILGVVNWLAEWGTYHLAIEAVGARVPAAGSLAALVVSNLGALPRLTPANLGVLQASLVGTLAAFSVSTPRALAAGLALQAVQTLPVLALALPAIASARTLRPGPAALPRRLPQPAPGAFSPD